MEDNSKDVKNENNSDKSSSEGLLEVVKSDVNNNNEVVKELTKEQIRAEMIKARMKCTAKPISLKIAKRLLCFKR